MSGNIDVAFSNAVSSRVFDLLIDNKIGYRVVSNGKESGTVKLNLRLGEFKKIKEKLSDQNVEIGKIKGLPRLFKKYGNRYGAWVGALLFAVLLFISQRVVWNIEVTGCENISPDSVIEKLGTLGFSYGTFYKSVDFDRLHNDYLRLYDDASWISVNMKGVVAKVEIKELGLPDEHGDGTPKNVVATEGGIIVSVETHSGKTMVSIGDHVSEGDLLITGIITVGEDGLRFADADGVIKAEVRREFSVVIPKVAEEKVYTGDECSEKSLIFFKNRIKLFGKGRISHQNYDKIYNKERIYLFSEFPLPAFIDSVIYREYRLERVSVTAEQAKEEFDRIYDDKVNETLGGAELLSSAVTYSESEDDYEFRCEVICIADIAQVKKIMVD